jgi:hypothetical protein
MATSVLMSLRVIVPSRPAVPIALGMCWLFMIRIVLLIKSLLLRVLLAPVSFLSILLQTFVDRDSL